MPNDVQSLWDSRERYRLSPDRYHQVPSIKSICELFVRLGKEWRTKRESINYVDLGSGDCKGSRVFADFLERCTAMPVKPVGVDASDKCESQCSEQGFRFVRLDLGEEPIPLKDLQVVTLFETIEHVFDTDFLLRSIRASMSHDSVLLVTTLNVVCWKNRILVPMGIQPINTEVSTKKLSYGFRLPALKRRVDVWPPAGHIRPFTLYSLQDILRDNGFDIIGSHGLENWRPLKFLETVAKNLCTGILVIASPS